MTWPIPTLLTNFDNDSPQVDGHPAHHNALADAVNELMTRLGRPPIVRLSGGAIGALANNTIGYVSWSGEPRDEWGLHSTGVNPTRVTIPALYAGLWRFGYTVEFTTFGTDRRDAWLSVNRSGSDRHALMTVPGLNNTPVCLSGAVDLELVANDYVELAVYQSSSGSMNIGGAFTRMFGTYIGSV